jgi:hypothetical protein
MFSRRSAFSPRHWLLASLLLFGSEIVLWTMPTTRSLFDWVLLIIGYLALSLILLELAAFYRARNIFDLITLAGIYGLLNALLLNPASALVDVPRTLVTRAMGAHSLIGLAMLAFFLWVSGRRRAPLAVFAGAALVGIAWGTWAHWSPLEFATGGETPLSTLLIAALVPLAAGGIALILNPPGRRAKAQMNAPLSPPEGAIRRMTRLDWALVLAAGLTLLIVRLAEGALDAFSLVTIPLLIVYCVAVLYFQRRKKGAMLLDGLEGRESSPALYTAGIIAVMLGGLLGYSLPRGAGASDPLAVIAVVFTGYGLVWLPAVSLVLGARAFARQARALRL